jgi:hypothetical protein
VPFAVDADAARVPTYAEGPEKGVGPWRARVFYLAPRAQPVELERELAEQLPTLGYLR